MIEEFMIVDIMSAAEIGPKILKRNGFDFILFANCMQFQMEMCSEMKAQTLRKDLKQNIQKMHMLKIVHSDIKPQNIMFSQYFRKNVMIDYGVANILSSQLWQKTETRFRGTYEYVGEEMKKTFMTNSVQQVNLYLNDAEMIVNSLRRIDKQNIFLHEFSSSKLSRNKIPLQKQDQLMEKDIDMNRGMGIRFKYHLYSFQKNGIVTQEFNQFIQQLTVFLFQRKKLQLFKIQNQSYLKDIKISSKEILISNMILKRNNNQIMYNVLYDLLFDFNFGLSKQNELQEGNNSFSLIWQGFEDKKLSFESFHLQSLHQNKKVVSQNIRYILHHTNQILMFSQEEYFQLLLELTSFWKGSVKVSIEQKQKAAEIMRFLFENQNTQKNQKIKYLQPNFLPKQTFVNKNCPNLIWVYGYLLSYCMSEEFDDFKSRNLMVIVKDCIFLSFQYDLFLSECLQKYLHFVIKERTEMMVSLAVIQCFEIYSLTSRHFLVETQRLKSNRQKTFQLIRYVLQECNTYAYQFYKKQWKDVLSKRNENVFLRIWWMLKNRFDNEITFQYKRKSIPQKWEENILSLVQLIEQQFSVSKDLQNVGIFQKARRLIYFSKLNVFENEIDSTKSLLFPSLHQLNCSQAGFDVLRLFQMDTSLIDMAEESLLYLQEYINCSYISKYFSLPLLFIRSFKKKDNEAMQNVLSTVFTNFESSFLNFNITLRIAKEKEKLCYFVIVNNSPYYIKQKRRIIFKAMQCFSVYPFSYVKQILFCGNILTTFDFVDFADNQISFSDIENEIRLFKSLFQKFYLKLGINYVTLILGFHILHHLKVNENTLGKYLHFRLQFFRLILQQKQQKDNQLHIINKSDNQFIGKLNCLFNNEVFLSSTEIEKYQNNPSNNSSNSQIQEYEIQFYRQIDEFNNDQDSNINNLFLLSGFSKSHEQKNSTFCETYFKIIKLKTVLFQNFRVAQFGKYAIQFFIKKHNFYQIFQLLVQFAIETYTKKSPIQYNILAQKLTELKINLLPKLTVFFVEPFIHYLFKLETNFNQIINPVVLFPLYMNILNYQQYFVQKHQIHKKILIKVLLLLEKFLVFNSNLSHYGKSQLDKFEIKHELYQQTIHFSMKYASRWKGERKMKILRRKLFKKIIQVSPEMIQYLNYFVLRVFKPNKQSNLEGKIYDAFCKFGNKFLMNLTIIDEDLKEDKRMSQKPKLFFLRIIE